MTLELRNVALSLNGKALIEPFSLVIEAGEIVTLMGPSGCGKSSLLAHIAGDLAPPLEGRGDIVLGGVNMEKTPPELRHIGRLFQDDLLFPHLTVGENILFGLPRGLKLERREMMRTALQRVDLEGFESRAPHTLSGGQRARVSLMRALMAKPRAMLLDEPFNKLDKDLRNSMRNYVFGHLKARNIPCLLVTHDIEDAPTGGRVFRIDNRKELTLA